MAEDVTDDRTDRLSSPRKTRGIGAQTAPTASRARQHADSLQVLD